MRRHAEYKTLEAQNLGVPLRANGGHMSGHKIIHDGSRCDTSLADNFGVHGPFGAD